ncbi:MAG: VCBS repeat-containing protein, partial [Aquabacterium sp.]|nr:VCBS repeat-containing protein [Ferruginibacter sp.]
KPDIMALMAQADEGIFIYYNQGNNGFKEERVLQLPPSYGSNYFELADFNNDGYPDIIATNGDNGDYPPILKAYHGIRIYLNDGRNNFSEKLFLHVNGIGKAIAKDFDGDGDLDIASIAFFADYKNSPEEGFIYWENKGDLKFEPSTFKEVNTGRWLTMEAGDFDGDGDTDLILGNAVFFMSALPTSLKNKLEIKSPSVLLLKNTLR